MTRTGAETWQVGSGADSMEHGDTVSRRTTNKKLTKLYWPSQKRSPKLYFWSQKSGGARPKNNFPLRAGSVPPLSLRTGASPHKHTLSNSFRRHCK